MKTIAEFLGEGKWIALLIVLSIIVGCKKDDISGPSGPGEAPQRNMHTQTYYDKVLDWDGSSKRWEFFSWRGVSGVNGCLIDINIHDGAGHVPSDFNAAAAREAIENGCDIWSKAIREGGITSGTSVRYESQGQAMHTTFPRIDVYFDKVIQNGELLGTAGVRKDSPSRTFSQVTVHVAAEFIQDGKTNVMTRDQYMATIAHEFGHAWGIYSFNGTAGHSPDVNDVMYKAATYWTLTDGDKATIQAITNGDAFYKPTGSIGPVTVRHAAAYAYGIAVTINGARYDIQKNGSLRISIFGSASLNIWECVSSGCRWDTGYILYPNRAYKIISDANPAKGFTLVPE